MPERTVTLATLRDVQRQILSYVVAHPDAKDSADGIRNWWLSPPHRGLPATEVCRALLGLVRRRWLSSTGQGTHATYGVDRLRLDEIRAFLRE